MQRGDLREFAMWGISTRSWMPDTTAKQYVTAVVRAERWMQAQGWRLEYAGAEELRAYSGSMASESSRNQARKALVAWFEYLVECRQLRDDNPAARLPTVKRRRRLPQAVDQHSAELIFKAAAQYGAMWQALVVVMLAGGLRANEARLLEPHMVERTSPSQIVLRFEGKGGQMRAVPINTPGAVRVLRGWMTANSSRQWLFPSPRFPDRPVSYSTIRKYVLEIGAAAGVDVRIKPHTLRHTVATRMLEQCLDLRVVQEFLGHASVATTEIYTLVRPARVAAAAAQLDFFGE